MKTGPGFPDFFSAEAGEPGNFPRWEKWLVLGILAGFVIVAGRVIHNFGWTAQDIGFHVDCTRQVLANPGRWFFMDLTSRPLLYWTGAACLRLTHSSSGFTLAATVFSVCGAAALGLLHHSSRRFIPSPILRCSALAFVAFLPVTVCVTVAYAADTVALLPFALAAWSLIRAIEAPGQAKTLGYASLAGMALAVGNFAKATFLVLPVAVLVAVLLFSYWKKLPPPKAVFIILLSALAPVLVGAWLTLECKRELRDLPPHHTFNWHETGEMTWRSLLLPYSRDGRIFAAPSYRDEAVDSHGKSYLPLLQPNNYSYPALLHLAVFTDILGVANTNRDGFGANRPEPEKAAARLAVASGVVFSLATLAATILFSLQFIAALVRRKAPPFSLSIWFLFGACWFVPLVAVLPYVQHAYQWGYWLPRLILPALWCFFLLPFAALGAMPAPLRPRLELAAAAVVAIQTAFNVASIWF